MKKLILCLVLALAIPNVGVCDETAAQEGGALPYKGSMMACDNGSTTGYAQCDSSGNITVVTGTSVTAATFAAADATTSIGGSYADAVNLPDSTKLVILDNQTNGDVWVSVDGGTTDHFHLTAGDAITLNLASLGLVTTATVSLKDGTTASTSGTFYVYSVK